MSKKEKALSILDNISYENGDDLSEHIAKLIAPPGHCNTSGLNDPRYYHESDNVKSKSVKPNNDFCSYCSEGGGLICCERCPAAYHYHCCEPPLDPNNLPSEEWLCNSCTPPKPNIITNESNKFLTNAVFNIGSIPTPFELPDDLYPTSDLPGSTELQSRKRRNLNPTSCEQNKRKFNSSYPYDLQSFTNTPVCYKCDLSDRGNRPLIFCYYCPLAFHLDCLYPPLPFRPTGMWMCPLHPQYSTPNFHALRLSARIQAHEASLEPVNEHMVRTKFLKKAKKCRNVFESVQRMTSIPGAIEQYYKIGLVFCRNNVTFRAPKTLKQLSAEKVSDKMARKEGSSGISSVCASQGCKHKAKQCKHYDGAAHSSAPAHDRAGTSTHGNVTLVTRGKIKSGSKRDNGLKQHNIGTILEGMSDSTIRQLAAQYLEQQRIVLSNGDISTKDLSPPTPPPLSLRCTTPLTLHKVSDNCLPLSHVIAHAFLQQGDTKYSIKKNSFVVGLGQQADLQLDPSVCNAVSLRHSCILFDKVTGIHELLNYSEYGTVVNALFYGCSSVPHSVARCTCSPAVPVHGWEGPCQLPDGAEIKVGCHSFTFRTNPGFVWSPELVIPSEGSGAEAKRESLDFL